MRLHEIASLIRNHPDTIVQVMTIEDVTMCAMCVPVRRLYEDWMSGDRVKLPENGDTVVICTFYADGKAYPLEDDAFYGDDFEALMRGIEKGFTIES